MAISLEKLKPSMFPDVMRLAGEGLDASLPEQVVQRTFFTHGWSHEDNFGYALTDGGRLVGILGLIFSERLFDGDLVPFCNLHSWYVQPEYRSKSLVMLRPVIDLKHHVITDFSASKEAAAISRRLGFSTIDRSAAILPPLPRTGATGVELCDLTGPAPPQLAELSEEETRIYRDHQGLSCRHLLVRANKRSSLLVYMPVSRHRFRYCEVLYMSQPRVVSEHHLAIRTHLLASTRAWYIAIESRLLGDCRIPRSFSVRANEKLCRSPRPLPRPIDCLYSEMVTLGLSTLPTFSQRVRATVRQLTPNALTNLAVRLPVLRTRLR